MVNHKEPDSEPPAFKRLQLTLFTMADIGYRLCLLAILAVNMSPWSSFVSDMARKVQMHFMYIYLSLSTLILLDVDGCNAD